MHDCNWPGCKVRVPRHIWACRTHWWMLPSIFRHNISKAWSGMITPEWTRASADACHWVLDNKMGVKADD